MTRSAVIAKALLLGQRYVNKKIEIVDYELSKKFLGKEIWVQACMTEDDVRKGRWYNAGILEDFDKYDDDMWTSKGWIGAFLPFRVDVETAASVIMHISERRPEKVVRRRKYVQKSQKYYDVSRTRKQANRAH